MTILPTGFLGVQIVSRLVKCLGELACLFAPAAMLLASVTSAAAQPAADRDDWMWNSNIMGWGGMMVGGGLLMLVFWGGIVLLVVLLVRGIGGFAPRHPEQSRHADQSMPTALEILKARFARGEIDKQEFEDRRRTLGE